MPNGDRSPGVPVSPDLLKDMENRAIHPRIAPVLFFRNRSRGYLGLDTLSTYSYTEAVCNSLSVSQNAVPQAVILQDVREYVWVDETVTRNRCLARRVDERKEESRKAQARRRRKRAARRAAMTW